MLTLPNAIIGVDPGRNGALVRLSFAGEAIIDCLLLSKTSREPHVLLKQIQFQIDQWKKTSRIVSVVLEQPFGIGGQGNVIEYGRAFGHLECALKCACDDVKLIYPSQWQPTLFPRVKGWNAKQQAQVVFQKLFGTQPGKKQHDGMVDAALIAVSELLRLNMFAGFPLINWHDLPLPKCTKKASK